MKTIKVSEQTYQRLMAEKADLIRVHSMNFLMDKTIDEVIDMLHTATEQIEYLEKKLKSAR